MDLIYQYQSQPKKKQAISVGEVLRHCQHRGDTTGFGLLLPVLWANHFGYQCAPLLERKSSFALLNSDTIWLVKGSSNGIHGRWEGEGDRLWWKGGQVLPEEARVKTAKSINMPVGQYSFNILILLGKSCTFPSAFSHWAFQEGVACLPKQKLVLLLRLLKSSEKSLVHFKSLLALT